MPEAASTATQDEEQQDQKEATSADAKTQVQSVEFPDAPQDTATACGGQLDILLDMDVPVTVVLGETQIPVRRLLQLGPGSVLQLEKPVEAPAELFLKDSKFAAADVVVVDNCFAVRIKQILGTGVPVNPSQE